MNQMKFTPPPELQQDVNCFWILDRAQEVYDSNEIVPDAFSDLIITLGAPLLIETAHGSRIELPRAYVCQLQKQPHHFVTQGPCQVVAVRLYPWAVSSLVEMGSAAPQSDFIPL